MAEHGGEWVCCGGCFAKKEKKKHHGLFLSGAIACFLLRVIFLTAAYEQFELVYMWF